MKLFKYGLPLAALAVLASCSNDNIDAPVGGQTPEVGDGSMYMTVNVSLPTAAGTKADSFAGYEPGSEDEYAVNGVQLVLFKLADGKTDAENDAEYYDTIDLGFGNLADENDFEDVQKKFQATFQIKGIELDAEKKPADKSKYFGLLIVNPNGSLPEFKDDVKTFNKWNLKTMKAADATGADYTSVMRSNGFMMSNAPVGKDDGTSTTLVFVDTEKFATSPAEAKEAAATFFVQRGVAKVRLDGKDFDNMPVYDAKDSAKEGASVQVDNWYLDVTNQVTFPVQNVYGVDGTYGFGSWYNLGDHYTAAASTGTQGVENHIWWAIDPNYFGDESDVDNTGSFSTVNAQSKINWTLVPSYSADDANSYAYCLENTMDYDQQIQAQTTRVIFKAKFIFDEYELADGTTITEDWTQTGDAAVNAGFIVYNDRAMLVAIDDLPKNDEGNAVIPAAASQVALNTIITDADKLDTYLKGLMIGAATDEVDWYPNGETYYVAYLRHFNNDEAPLPSNLDVTSSSFNAGSLATSYTNQQLGRYGVLRNNVYNVNVLGFFGYGSPEVPEPDPGTPDDKEPEKKYNAIVDINVLNWAVRQNDYIPR